MKNPRVFLCVLTLLPLILSFGPAAYAQRIGEPPVRIEEPRVRIEEPSVVIYDGPNFQAPSKSFGIGSHRLLPAQGFNDVTSSIKVPAGLVVFVYEHSDEGGGYGEWVDFLEDQPDLSKYRFDNKISHLEIHATRRGTKVYERNKIENGRFVKGDWVQAREDSINPNAVVAPFKPPNMPEITSFEAEPALIHQGQSTTLRWQTANAEQVRIGERYPMSGQDAGPQSINWQEFVSPSGTSQKNPAQPTVYVLEASKGDKVTSKNVLVDIRRTLPTFCSISGRIIGNRPSYQTFVELRRADTNQVVQRERVFGVVFKFERVPVGSYRVAPKAAGFPPENGRPSNLGFLPKADGVTCRPNVPYSLQFRIHRYTEG